jgi:integrase
MRTPKRVDTANGVRWVVRYRDAGNRQTSQRFDSEPEATKFCIDLDAYGPARAEQLLYARLEPAQSDVPTLDQWIDKYIATRSKASPGTRAKYRTNWARSFGPEIGNLPIDQVTGDDVARVVIKLSEVDELSDKTIANFHGVLAGAMKIAHGRGLIPINPCLEVALPERTSHTETEPRFLTEDEYEELRSVFHPHFLGLLDTTAGTGIRWSEAAALTPRDVNFKTQRLHVTKAVKWHPNASERVVGPPKTKQSRRTITLPDPVVAMLAQQVQGKAKDDLLFTMPQGGPLWHRTFWSRYWVRAFEDSTLPEPRPRWHDLRHSHASWLISRNVPLTVIQRRLGHSSIKVTSDLYGHLMPDVQVAEREAAGQVFLGVRARAALGA